MGQNGRPLMGPQMGMSSLVLTIPIIGVPNFDPYPYIEMMNLLSSHEFSRSQSDRRLQGMSMMSPCFFLLRETLCELRAGILVPSS